MLTSQLLPKGVIFVFSRYEQFSYAISSIQRHIQKIERDEMITLGYKGAFAQYLAAMTHYPDGLTAAQLCEICDKDKAAVSRTVAEMEEKHLIQRGDRQDSSYRARLRLTDEGRRAAAFVLRRAEAAVDACGLTDDNRDAFYAAQNMIARNLESVCLTGLPPHNHERNE